MKIITTTEVSTATMGDIAITAAEGGIGYWSQIETYRPSRWVADEGLNREVEEDFVFYTIHEIKDDEGGYKDEGIDITPLVIGQGIHEYLAWGYQFSDPEDLAAMDSSEADNVIQLGLFGGLRYS